MRGANPRAACVEALSRGEKGGEFADQTLHRVVASARLGTMDRAFFTETFYGVIRNRRLLDFVISRLREGEIDDATRQVLRLGIYQLLCMRIPHHAVVNETVSLAGRARTLANALLRRCIREEAALRDAIAAAPAGVRYSHPEMLLERWRAHFGEEKTRELCEWNNKPAEVFMRANTLKVTPGELARAHRAGGLDSHPLMLRVQKLPLPWILQGLCYMQDPSTLAACELLAPRPGESVLDACAAPGGKTSYLAALMGNTGSIVACDVSEKRLARLRENLTRLGVQNTSAMLVDWLAPDAARHLEGATFDRILLDAPCSNTGVIRRRVDVRWRLASDEFSRMQEKQLALVRAVAPLLKPGGSLVYSTCSIEPEENEAVVARILAELPGLTLAESRQTLPFRDGVDGAFAARLEKTR